jgi:hypothetical protein
MDFGGQRLKLLDAPRHERHVHAAAREFACQSGTDAGGCAGDEHSGGSWSVVGHAMNFLAHPTRPVRMSTRRGWPAARRVEKLSCAAAAFNFPVRAAARAEGGGARATC